MKVVIMRHGDAVLGDDDDASRALTAVGRQQSLQMALWLKSQLPLFDKVLVSPYLRAQQTWQLVSSVFEGIQAETWDELVPHGRSHVVADYLAALADQHQQVLVISHLPIVGYLVAELCPGQMPPMFTTSAMACVDYLDQQGHLLWQQSPYQLRSM